MRLLLLRHAESEWNRLGVWQGTADPPLSDRGRQHAAEVAAAIGKFSAVWSSGLSRAIETAEIIAAAQGIGTVRTDDRLAEVHFAGWQGLRVDEIDAGWPGYRVAGRRPDGAERDMDVLARGLAGLADIAATGAGESVLVVTHGGLIRVLCTHLGAPIGHLPNLAGRWLRRAAGGWAVDGAYGPLSAPAAPSTL